MVLRDDQRSQRAAAEIGKALIDRGAKPKEAWDLAGLVLYERWRRTAKDEQGRFLEDELSGDELAELMGLSQASYWRWRQRFRRLMHCDPEHLRVAEGVEQPPPGWFLKQLEGSQPEDDAA